MFQITMTVAIYGTLTHAQLYIYYQKMFTLLKKLEGRLFFVSPDTIQS